MCEQGPNQGSTEHSLQHNKVEHRLAQHAHLEQPVYAWLSQSRAKGIFITAVLVIEKAKQVAHKIGFANATSCFWCCIAPVSSVYRHVTKSINLGVKL